ncbi:PTS-dependent dihydroxyacetone kinase phosphotransferase subunit DhaM [Clostridium botulinum D/C]|uniref:dihydroxyacetone kinase phosphoryl donor subunit DhaM n=1 Tax=Clostridium botulinum TaxID=1491 RepID=UPI001E5EBB8F|nr:dihydroxyacetone kinase phosphoryl donor subunit DhaM [Clostridium botulinum]MCD3350686.1 PTS-dependent dihydroxyacetone kinase phosphotransferase subunit DhaM [Clostridium botulinum D/C]MCD3359707.1 PTS-dependent dihydroxyacetone kinase phosphotransferase subunit DhaM [Clostridium botulinum D/C]MCD3361228.1 PTS-dependent dihydroxyacetone kinase phosphotransferase subunit DhaM [Clostridium botulinum D/C]MCD3365404.1 PTS-dependent dihydroxyacetone kinase phosphotransferase subunit DhaM [Clost
MVGIVLVSHSSNIVEGLKELLAEMAPTTPIVTAGGTRDGRIGTDMDKIMEGIQKIYSEDGVIVLFDLGSAYMNAEMAIECLDEEMIHKVKIIDAPLVEGALTAAVQSSIGKSIEEIEKALGSMKLGKIS